MDTREVMYLNSGDWVENLTSIEYHNGQWSLYKYKQEAEAVSEPDASTPTDQEIEMLSAEEIFNLLIIEFNDNPVSGSV